MSTFDKYDKMSENIKQSLQELAASRRIRNGAIHEDGSHGDIRITHKELLNLLVEAYLEGYHDH